MALLTLHGPGADSVGEAEASVTHAEQPAFLAPLSRTLRAGLLALVSSPLTVGNSQPSRGLWKRGVGEGAAQD